MNTFTRSIVSLTGIAILTACENGFNATLPSGASATYNGSMTITGEVPTPSNPSGRIYYGRMQLNADFAGKTVAGQLGDFGRINPPEIGGALLGNVSGSATFSGIIAGTAMTSQLNGSVDGDAISGAMTGSFFTDKDTGRHIVNGFTANSLGSQPESVAVFLVSQ